MINSVKLSSDIRRILNNFSPVLGEDERRAIVSVALARAFASGLHIPTSAVASLHSYYIQSFDKQIVDALNGFNEVMVVDIRTIRELIFKFYKLRYDTVYDDKFVMLYLSQFAAISPEFFPANICSVITKELASGEVDDYFSKWASIVETALDEVKANATNEPIPLVSGMQTSSLVVG